MKNNMKKMAKTITLGLVLGTALTAAQPVWATETKVADGTYPLYYDADKGAIRWGSGTTASGMWATAFGEGTTASGKWSTAFGKDTQAGILGTLDEVDEEKYGIYATAWGYGARAGAIKLSEDDVTTGDYKDRGLKAGEYKGKYATAFGTKTLAIGEDSVAMGSKSTASGDHSFAMGSQATASGTAAVAMGQSVKASANNAFVVGWNSEASGKGSVAIGTLAKANSDYAVAIGQYAVTGIATKATAGENEVINEFAVGGGIGGGKTYYSQITGVAYGVNDHDAATVGQVKTRTTMGATAGNYYGASADVVTAVGSLDYQVKINADAIVSLQSAVGDESSGLVKDVADLKSGKADKATTLAGYGITDAYTKTETDAKINEVVSTATSGAKITGISLTGTTVTVTEGSGAGANVQTIDLAGLQTAQSQTNANDIAALKNTVENLETTEVAAANSNVSVVKTKQGKVNTYTVGLSNTLDLTNAGSVTVGNALMNNNGFKVGNTKVTGSGISFEGSAVAVTANGINAGGNKITNVADGTEDTDAATVGQVNQLIGSVGGNFNELSGQVNRLGTRISKVGAGAAAMASMHPVYDDDSKLSFSAGLGSYRSEKALAIGAFYRPNERVVVNLGSTMGNDDNMVGLGVNFALDRNVGVKLPSKAVMARELNELREKTAEQDAKIAQLMAMINALKKK